MRISADDTSPYYGGILAHSLINEIFLDGTKQAMVVEFCTDTGYVICIDENIKDLGIATQQFFGEVTYTWVEDFTEKGGQELLTEFLLRTNQI